MKGPVQKFAKRMAATWLGALLALTLSSFLLVRYYDISLGGAFFILAFVTSPLLINLLAMTARWLSPTPVSGQYVLFLRPFSMDNVIAEQSLLTPGVASQAGLAGGVLLKYFGARSLERALARECERRLAPLVAIGDPDEEWPSLGARKVYCEDAEWQQWCTKLMDGARCMMLQLGDTPGLSWELEQLRLRGYSERLFIVIEPEAAGADDQMSVTAGNRWDRARTTLLAAGWRVPSADPGPGAVITFTADHEGRLLVRNRHDVAMLVEQIVAQVQSVTAEVHHGA